MQFNVLTLIYYFLVVSLALVSGILSYYGVKLLLGHFAIVFAVVISVWLVGANIVIQRDRQSGHGPWRGLLMFAFGAFFSFASNFNVVYTNQMQRDLAAQTVSEAYESFTGNLVVARTALQGNSQIELARRQRASFETELAELRRQILDPNNRGIGALAGVHIERIYRMIGERLTEQRRPASGAPEDALLDWYDRFRQAAVAAYERKADITNAAELTTVIELIDQQLEQYKSIPKDAATTDLAVLQEFSTISQEIERRTNALLPADEQVTAVEIDFLDGRLGELIYTLNNGFVERPNPSASLISALFASAVDLFPVIFAFAAFRTPGLRSGQSLHERPGPRRGRQPGGIT